jgi:restriction system protein
LNVETVDFISAFHALRGQDAGETYEIVPITPSLRLNREDRRFIDNRATIDSLPSGDNLAAMEWDDFEHLVRELFEHEFAAAGAEVRITRASRDQGVDAIIFDPDPLRGGKIVVQAKRYTIPVDVSAVRDLYGTVVNEGANTGILVTTSHYGPDAYQFAQNKPLKLLNGAELLGLLKKAGYNFRIDLAEARSRAANR